jgi:hypothetical protein
MHTVELLEEALQLAAALGINVRQDWLSGSGGACEIKGKRWLFVDLSLSHVEQLDQVLAALRDVPALSGKTLSPPLQRLVAPRKAAA